MKAIAAALGLNEAASEATCLSTLTAGFVPMATHQGTLAQLSAATTELAALKKTSHDAEVDRELEQALKDKKILPAQKPGFVAMAASPEGFGHVRAILGATAAGSFAGPSSLEGQRAEKGVAVEKDAATLSAEAKTLAAERGISFADAMSIVSRPKTTA